MHTYLRTCVSAYVTWIKDSFLYIYTCACACSFVNVCAKRMRIVTCVCQIWRSFVHSFVRRSLARSFVLLFSLLLTCSLGSTIVDFSKHIITESQLHDASFLVMEPFVENGGRNIIIGQTHAEICKSRRTLTGLEGWLRSLQCDDRRK